MEKKKCNFCGSTEYEQRRTDYLYSYKGNYLLVPNTPVEICQNCGMIYYNANVLKKIEKHFFAIQKNVKYLIIWKFRGGLIRKLHGVHYVRLTSDGC